MPEIMVRPAQPGDLPELLDLYGELADGRQAALPATGPAAARQFEQILSDPSRTILVAVTGGRVAGTADLTIVANLTHGGCPWAIVENVVVSAAARGRGTGTALMERASEVARRAGCYKIQLLSRKQRVRAHKFYQAIGFEAAAEGFRRYFE
jgi:GNAT superfamily N-acetyltransferase